MHSFGTSATCSRPAAGCFSCSRLRDTQGGARVLMAQVRAPAGLRDACSGRSMSHELAPFHGVAFRRARVKRDEGNPHKPTKKYDQQVLACSYAVCNSSHLAWSPGHLALRAWSPGHLLLRPSSRATAVTLRAHFFVPRCFCACDRGWQMEISHSGAIGFASGILL